MKRTLFAAALLVLIITLSFYTTRAIQTRSDEIVHQIESGNLAQAHTTWEASATLFGALLRHDELSDIDTLFLRVQLAEVTGDDDERYYAEQELSEAISHLVDVNIPYVRNIL